MAGEQAGNAYRKMFQSFFVKGDVAREFGLDFTDKKGEFGGMDNMFKQFEKLKQFNTEERTSIIKKIFGDDAETMQVVNLMINRGLEGIKDMNKELKGQADLQTRVNEQLGTLRNIWDAISGTFTNAMAS